METLENIINKMFFVISNHKNVNYRLDLYKKIKELSKKEETKLLNEIKENYTFCDYCKKYHKNEEYSIEEKLETNTQITYTDAGYGDSDKIGEVTYFNKYFICKKCNNKKLMRQSYIKTENERYARG